jgi:hypothetical protein
MGKYAPKKKVVYLDQKDWIFLARGYYDSSFKINSEICNLVLEASKKKAIFPLSIVHFDETLRRLDAGSRTRLATFMVKVSKGYTILPGAVIMKSEVRQAALKKLGLPTIDFSKFAIGRGVSHMLGAKGELVRKEGTVGPDLPEETKKKILGYVDSPQALLQFLTSQKLVEKSQHIQQNHASIVEKMEQIRRRNAMIRDNDLRYRVCIARFLVDVIGPWLGRLMVDLNLPMKAIIREDWTQKEFTEFFQNMPTAYCLFTLTYHRDQYMQRSIERNDINDIWALTMAIPYCDIVVTESMWGSIARQSKLDKIYNTLILSSAEELKNYI